MVEGPPLELVADIAGDLGAATAAADAVERHLVLTLAIELARLERVPHGQLAELSRAAAHFEEAGLRVLGSLNPSVSSAARDMVEAARAEGELTARRAIQEGHSAPSGPLRSL